MNWLEALSLVAAGGAAGAINAVAGGGTLITFPTLLALGTPAIAANATSTLALVIGTGGGVYGYRQHLPKIKTWLVKFLPVSLLGGLIGSALLTFTSDKAFSKLVPFLILFATLIFLSQEFFRKFAGFDRTNEPHQRRTSVALIFQFAISIYGGYFGAGIGILMLASLAFLGLEDVHQMNTIKTVVGSLINIVAATWFIFAGYIDWPKMAMMALGAIFGYYCASHYSQRISQKSVRTVITIIGFSLAAVTFYKEFLQGKLW